MNPHIQVDQVVKNYSGHCALDHVSLTIERGSIYGLLGPNGAGKTTLIRMLNHITRPDSGKILLGGMPLTDADVRRIGYLPEERGLYKKMKVLDHIVYIARLKGMDKTAARRQAMSWLERMNLEQWAGNKVEALSKGMAQKVQFISTVVHEPELLIFDEPFSGFDPINAEQLKQEIIRLNQQGSTIVFSTHNMASVEEVCQEFTLINKSRAVLQGNVAQVRRAFGGNVYNVHLTEAVVAPNPALFTINELSPHPSHGTQVRITLAEGVNLRAAISFINEHYTIVGINEELPSMHEIFISTVEQTNQQ